MSEVGPPSVAELVVNWQVSNGRNQLPWQQTRDPYRVWLSEIMLQQTQVTTVLGYYERFLARFPNVAALAEAPQDDVMGLWSGLGYYTRARNLHRCAQRVMSDHAGAFPPSAEVLATLPGIGRSTAGAIAAFCFSERVPILDANVRRVLTRLLGFDQDLAQAKSERQLWSLAESLLPDANLWTAMPRYTQGLMDLGASVCTPRLPNCGHCPLVGRCVAFRQGDPEKYPVKTRRLARRSESWHLLLIRDAKGNVWLQRRPATGIWAGMYCVPVFADRTLLDGFIASLGDTFQPAVSDLPPFLHVLTHRDLHLHPTLLTGDFPFPLAQDGAWFGADAWDSIGLPAPIRKLLESTQTLLW